MKTKAMRMYGANDIRLEEFELPEITADEVLIRVVSDSVCASTYKAIKQGSAHKRVPENIAETPVIIGHEMCGEIVEVGENVKNDWNVGQKVVIQPALKLPTGYDPGYSYPYIGGNTQYAVVPKIVLERGCLLPYGGDSFFAGSLAEALGCCIRGYKGFYHTDYTNYERFDGAKKGGKIGLFEAANHGTLFLDEISEMDMALQAKLLRAIQEGKVRPVGSVKEVSVDVRLICASNADLPKYIAERKFRQDLYYRLSTFLIHIPPLRERPRDIAALAEMILNDLAKKIKRSLHITPDALEVLKRHDWPGNVRELRNVLEFSAYLSPNGIITPESLPDHYTHNSEKLSSLTLAEKVRRFEREEIHRLLEKNGSDLNGKKLTAQQLGISLATLYNKLSEDGSKI